jgi:hypothetical protein
MSTFIKAMKPHGKRAGLECPKFGSAGMGCAFSQMKIDGALNGFTPSAEANSKGKPATRATVNPIVQGISFHCRAFENLSPAFRLSKIPAQFTRMRYAD